MGKTLDIVESSPRTRLYAVLERAQEGDQSAIAEARGILADEPELWEGIGQLAQTAISSWIKAGVGEENAIVVQEGVRRHLVRLKQDLDGTTPDGTLYTKDDRSKPMPDGSRAGARLLACLAGPKHPRRSAAISR